MNVTDNNFFKFFKFLNASKYLMEKVKRANSIQHSGGKISSQDWSELYMLQNQLAANAPAEARRSRSLQPDVGRSNHV